MRINHFLEIVYAYRYDCLDPGRTHKKKLERYRRQRKQYQWHAARDMRALSRECVKHRHVRKEKKVEGELT